MWEWQSSSLPASLGHWHVPRVQSQSTESPEAWGWEEHPCRVHQSLCLWRSQEWRERYPGCGSWFPRVSSWGWAHNLRRWCTGVGTHRSLGSAACWCGQWCLHCFLESALASQSPDWWQWFYHLLPAAKKGVWGKGEIIEKDCSEFWLVAEFTFCRKLRHKLATESTACEFICCTQNDVHPYLWPKGLYQFAVNFDALYSCMKQRNLLPIATHLLKWALWFLTSCQFNL